jgi:dTDP-4-amino-4,6-dideoxygalactose transaminase
MSRIFLSPPAVGSLERDFVMAAIDSNWVAPIGPDLDAFEADLAAAGARSHAVGLSTGTAGLHLCLHALGIGPADRVALSTFTFAATANAVAYTGAQPVFIDAELASWNLDPALLEEALVAAKNDGRPIRAVIAVDLYGQCCDYDPIVDICNRHDAVLISDAAESLGAYYRGRRAGSVGRAAVFSFNGNKIITTSGGGVVVTDDDDFAKRIRFLATQAREPTPHYEHVEIGFNYRLSNILAAFGRGQIATLADRVAAKKALNVRYRQQLAHLPITFAPVPEWSEPNYWLTCIVIDPTTSVDREAIRLALEANDIESRPLWKPMHLQPVFKGSDAHLTGVSEALFDTGLCLPSGSALTPDEQDRVIATINDVFASAPA